MSIEIKNFADSAKGFTQSPLGIIALFIVLVYGFATLAATSTNLKDHIEPLVYFLVLFPFIVFIGFLWLVSKHSEKIYGPSDFKDESNFMKMKLSAVASLAAATAKQQNVDDNKESIDKQLNSIVDMVSNSNHVRNQHGIEQWKSTILWVDDHPENNILERKALASQGFTFALATSTNEALELLSTKRFAAIISDLERRESSEEGLLLLSKIRDKGINTPYFVYCGLRASDYKKAVIEKGGQGCTNIASELFQMIIDASN